MEWTYANLLQAREAVDEVLGQLELEAYLFAVGPSEEGCEVRVEYAADEGWKSKALTIDDASLLATLDDPEARRRLVQAWQRSLNGAKKRSGDNGSH